MLTPGSLRAEAIKACFMEAGFTNSRLRTVLQDRRGQAVFLWICWCHIPKLQIQDTAGGEMRDGLVCVAVRLSCLGEREGWLLSTRGGWCLISAIWAHKWVQLQLNNTRTQWNGDTFHCCLMQDYKAMVIKPDFTSVLCPCNLWCQPSLMAHLLLSIITSATTSSKSNHSI